ncbi:MAG: hypothetical protein ACI4FZ_08710 [Lachnospiraceae bacterium]
MILTIGTTELTVTNCYAYQHQSGKRELRITIPQTEIEYSALKALLNANEGEIVLTKNDRKTETFCGYKTTYTITDKKENEEDEEIEVFYVVIDCVDEAVRRALEAQAKAAAATAQVAALALTVTAKEEQIADLVENEADLLYEVSLLQLGITE